MFSIAIIKNDEIQPYTYSVLNNELHAYKVCHITLKKDDVISLGIMGSGEVSIVPMDGINLSIVCVDKG